MEWKEVLLGELVDIYDSKRIPLTSQEREKIKGDIPYYGAQGIIDYINQFLFDGEYILIAEDGNNIKSRQENIAQIAKGKFWVNNHAHILQGKIEQNLLCYIINHTDISGYVTGSAQPKLNQANLLKIPIKIPVNLSDQRKIAGILSALDSKIENNNKINANLEAQAEALFKSWFVDFTPFKDQPFVDSELGPIPQGWKVGTLFDVANLHDRYRRPLSSNQRSLMAKKYPYYGATSLMDFVEDYIFDGEYVLMGEDGSVVTEKGYPFIQYVWGKIWVNNHAHVLSGKDGFPTELLIPFLKTYNIKGLVTGAVQAKLNQANMAQIQIPIPPKKNINNLSVIIKSIYKKYRLLTEENQRLAALRDTLLPKLMSGEIKL
ncbi:MAG: restriction endonuclease subunit S [Bacteroidales bacterium]|nr:restriction endonuclease subunit S [Bacteroidales bacterium]